MVRGVEDIIRWFDNSEQLYWRIYPHKGITGGNIVMQSTQVEGQSHGDAIEQLKTKIRHLHRGHFTMVAFSTADRLPQKGYHLTEIEIPQQEAVYPQIAGPVGITPDEVQSKIDAALTSYKQTVELETLRGKVKDLEKENKELKDSVNSPWNKVIGAIAPYSDRIIGNWFPPQANVAGLPVPDSGPVDNNIAEPVTELTPEQSEVISEFITTLSETDVDWLNTLRRLTKKIKEQPSMIGMVKNFI